MNIVIKDFSYELIKTETSDNYVEYQIVKNATLIGYITKAGAEVLYTARDTDNNIINTGATIRDALEGMILNMFYTNTFKGDRFITTLGAWMEGKEVQVEYTQNNTVKHAKRVVRYSKSAGDLYIVIDNRKYFYCEFN